MHPELLNNSLFLRYYGMWQRDPDSVVFTSVADFFLKYGLINEAFEVCQKGIVRHPDLTIGKIVMAKIYIARGEYDEAEKELSKVIRSLPDNKMAADLLAGIKNKKNKGEENFTVPNKWHTVTMARIYAAQGHIEKAREVYNSVLKRDPNNKDARMGLESIINS